MNRFVRPYKIILIFLVLAAALTVYTVALYDLQIVKSEDYRNQSTSNNSTNYQVAASRGDILDRNGVVLVSSRAAYNITINRNELLASDDPNAVVFDIIEAANAAGVKYNDTFPLTSSAPFDYPAEMTETQRSRLDKYFEFFELDADISASDLFLWMKKHYGLDYTMSITDARRIMGVRYELEARVIMNIPDYIFAEDVSVDFIAALMEKNYNCIHVSTSQARTYFTEYAAHILGNTGSIYPEEYEYYKELGYPMDAVVGKNGVEAAFENYLHGTSGTRSITTDDDGNVLNDETITEPVAGENVFLTIDIGMQEAAENALRDVITEINTDSEEEDKAEGGAVVVELVDTGEILACASYPTFNLETFNADYAVVSQNELNPYLNRATQGTYNPGSTFKMVTALAGLRSGKIDVGTYIEDKGRYTAYKDYQPKCWIYPHNHGYLNVVGAIENSCNYFFYWLGDKLGLDAINYTAEDFGFGSATGIEIPEKSGNLSTSEYKWEIFNESWYAGDTLRTAIGQGYMLVSPLQLANYVSTIANGGTVYKPTLLREIYNSAYTEKTFDNSPVVTQTMDDEEGYFSALQSGMRAVAATGTASEIFGDYRVKVACKTGTVQSDATSTNTGVFVCYAPANDPEIAISVIVENGISGATVTTIAQRVLDYYFADKADSLTVIEENTLLK